MEEASRVGLNCTESGDKGDYGKMPLAQMCSCVLCVSDSGVAHFGTRVCVC